MDPAPPLRHPCSSHVCSLITSETRSYSGLNFRTRFPTPDVAFNLNNTRHMDESQNAKMRPPSTRRGHKRSRNGCTKCKARHVKCDEQRPCRNCVRFGATCSLVADRGQASPYPVNSSVPSSPRETVFSPVELSEQNDALPTPGPRPVAAPTEARSNSQDWAESLRLLHHYDTVVSHILANEPSMVDIWVKRVPEAAFEHEFLMHGLLALSAQHYAQVYPDKRCKYALISSHYQSLALQVYSTSLHSINDDNFEPYFFLATLIFIISMCSIADPQHIGDTITPGDVAQSFILLQGIKNITEFKPMKTWSPAGPLSPFMESEDLLDMNHSCAFERRMEQLHSLARALNPSMEAINLQSSCLLAIESLRTTHVSCISTVPEFLSARRIWLWPMCLTPLFLELICDNHHVALIILGHYAALIKRFEHPKWMNNGWSDRVMAAVEAKIGAEWQHWLDWPKQVLRRGIDVEEMDS